MEKIIGGKKKIRAARKKYQERNQGGKKKRQGSNSTRECVRLPGFWESHPEQQHEGQDSVLWPAELGGCLWGRSGCTEPSARG